MGILHTAILNTIDDVKITSISEKESILTKYIKKGLPTTNVYDDYEKMLNSENLDLVYITTPTNSHLHIMLFCIRKNINFFVEKPLTINLDDTKKICAELRQTNLTHAVGYNFRFVDTFAKVKSLLDNRILGTINSVKSSMFASNVFSKSPGWRFKRKKSGGGVLLDLGCHVIDLLLWYFGKIETVEGKIESIYSSVEDFADMNMKFAKNIKGEMKTSWSVKGYRIPEVTIEIIGSNGFLKVNQDYIDIKLKTTVPEFKNKESRIYKQALENGVFFDVGGPDYTKEDWNVVQCIKEKKTAPVDVFEASKIQSVIQAMYDASSLRSREKVDYID